jgi:hypothetical protein
MTTTRRIYLYAAMAGAVLLIASMSLSVSISSRDQHECQMDAQIYENQKPEDCPTSETIWQKTLRDPVAYHTGWLTLFTLALAAIGFAQGALTDSQIALAREEFIASHRPRLRVRLVKIKDHEIGKPIKIEFTVANAGDSEAQEIKAQVTVSIQSDGSSAEKKFDIGPMLAPGEPLEISQTINLPWQSSWKPGTRDVRVHGHIAYKDKNGIARRTGFYRFSSPDLNRFRLPADADIERDYEFED